MVGLSAAAAAQGQAFFVMQDALSLYGAKDEHACKGLKGVLDNIMNGQHGVPLCKLPLTSKEWTGVRKGVKGNGDGMLPSTVTLLPAANFEAVMVGFYRKLRGDPTAHAPEWVAAQVQQCMHALGTAAALPVTDWVQSAWGHAFKHRAHRVE